MIFRAKQGEEHRRHAFLEDTISNEIHDFGIGPQSGSVQSSSLHCSGTKEIRWSYRVTRLIRKNLLIAPPKVFSHKRGIRMLLYMYDSGSFGCSCGRNFPRFPENCRFPIFFDETSIPDSRLPTCGVGTQNFL